MNVYIHIYIHIYSYIDKQKERQIDWCIDRQVDTYIYIYRQIDKAAALYVKMCQICFIYDCLSQPMAKFVYSNFKNIKQKTVQIYPMFRHCFKTMRDRQTD